MYMYIYIFFWKNIYFLFKELFKYVKYWLYNVDYDI